MFFQAIGQPCQRDVSGNQSLDELGGASWITITAVRMLRRAATGIGASKTAIWPVLALGGERTHANQGVSLRMVIILF